MNHSIRYPRRVISPIHQDSFEQEAVVDFKTCFPQAAETNRLAACAPQKDTASTQAVRLRSGQAYRRRLHAWHQRLCYPDAIRDSRIVTSSAKNPCGTGYARMAFSIAVRARPRAQLDPAPTLAVFASRSVISTPPRFARDYSAHATLVISVKTHRLRTSDAERDQGVSRKPSLYAIRESRIASSQRDKMIDSTASRILALSGLPICALNFHSHRQPGRPLAAAIRPEKLFYSPDTDSLRRRSESKSWPCRRRP